MASVTMKNCDRMQRRNQIGKKQIPTYYLISFRSWTCGLVRICMSGICSHWPPLLTSFFPRIMCSSVCFSLVLQRASHSLREPHHPMPITVILHPHICTAFNSWGSACTYIILFDPHPPPNVQRGTMRERW